jgi:outer membrane biosynthesis protein TonB
MAIDGSPQLFGHLSLTRNAREDQLGLGLSIVFHIFGIFFFLNLDTADAPIDEEIIAVEMVALTALGEPPPPQALPRIVTPPPPPPPSDKTVSISRSVEKKEKPKPKKKPKKKPKPKKKKIKSNQKSEPKKKKRKVTKNDLFSGLSQDDPRADKGPRRGDRRGHIEGTSTQWNGGVVNAYISRLQSHIARRFKAPASIEKRKLKKLSVKIYVQLKSVGRTVAQIKGQLKIKKTSGNKFFDDAALRALKSFTAEGGSKLPLPKSTQDQKNVLKRGFIFNLNGKDMM